MNTELFLIRHGQPVLQKALLGSTDSPLSELGWSQMEACVTAIKNIDLIISSPLIRCQHFAEKYAEFNQLPFKTEKDFQECFFGDWDGITYQKLFEDYPEAMALFLNDPLNNPPPNAESLTEFNARVISVLHKTLENNQGKRIILLTHAGVIRTLVGWCLKMNLTEAKQFKLFSLDYASCSKISIFHDTENDKETLFPQLNYLNNTHFQRAIVNE